MYFKNLEFMDAAISQAKKAYEIGEVPVGAIITQNGHVLASSHNLVITNNDPTAHAEIMAVRLACDKLETMYLDDCEIFVTLEPCVMCMKAIILAKIKKLYFGAYSFKTGAVFHEKNMLQCNNRFNLKVVGGLKETECSVLLKNFFISIREDSF